MEGVGHEYAAFGSGKLFPEIATVRQLLLVAQGDIGSTRIARRARRGTMPLAPAPANNKRANKVSGSCALTP